MTSTTVAEFATELKKPADTLLEQLRSAGVPKSSASDSLTEADKQKLLSYLQASHGTGTGERKKITLTKKSTTEIKQADATGKARTIQVEVRKKRTLIKRDDEAVAAEPVAAEPAIDHAELARREEEARRQAELIRRQEEELAEKRRQREQEEARLQAEAQAAERAAAEAAAQAAQAAAAAQPLSREEREERARQEAASLNAAAQAGKTASVAAAAAEDTAAREAAEKAEADKRAREEAVAKAAAESKARADEESARARELEERRRKALAEAEAIRAMMNAPKKVLVAKKEEPKPEAKPAVKGTLHKPAGTPAAGARSGAAAPSSQPAGAGKEVKSAKLSSSWAGDPAKKKAIPTRGDTTGGVGRNAWRSGPKGRKGHHDREEQQPAAPQEARVIDRKSVV